MRSMATSMRRAGTKGVPRAERERAIVAAAIKEFGLRGYESASLAAIAQRVEITKTLVHQYFGTKQDLYLACLREFGDSLVAEIDAAMALRTPFDSPLAVLRAVFFALEGRREAWFLLYDSQLPPGSRAAKVAGRYRSTIERQAVVGATEVLQATGRDDPLDADALAYAWRGLVTALVHWWIRHPGQSSEAMANRCARLFSVAGAAFGSKDSVEPTRCA